jgi:hypothetical protein
VWTYDGGHSSHRYPSWTLAGSEDADWDGLANWCASCQRTRHESSRGVALPTSQTHGLIRVRYRDEYEYERPSSPRSGSWQPLRSGGAANRSATRPKRSSVAASFYDETAPTRPYAAQGGRGARGNATNALPSPGDNDSMSSFGVESMN